LFCVGGAAAVFVFVEAVLATPRECEESQYTATALGLVLLGGLITFVTVAYVQIADEAVLTRRDYLLIAANSLLGAAIAALAALGAIGVAEPYCG